MQCSLKMHACCYWCDGLKVPLNHCPHVLNNVAQTWQDRCGGWAVSVDRSTTLERFQRRGLRAKEGGARQDRVSPDLQGEAEGLAAPAGICIVQAAPLRLQMQYLRSTAPHSTSVGFHMDATSSLHQTDPCQSCQSLGMCQGHVGMHEQEDNR